MLVPDEGSVCPSRGGGWGVSPSPFLVPFQLGTWRRRAPRSHVEMGCPLEGGRNSCLLICALVIKQSSESAFLRYAFPFHARVEARRNYLCDFSICFGSVFPK